MSKIQVDVEVPDVLVLDISCGESQAEIVELLDISDLQYAEEKYSNKQAFVIFKRVGL